MLKKKLKQFLGLFPQSLPKSGSEFQKLATFIFETYDIPDMPSYRQAIASMIMHLGPQVHKKSPWFFVISIRKAMSNQVAYDQIDQIRNAQKEEAKANESEPSEVAANG